MIMQPTQIGTVDLVMNRTARPNRGSYGVAIDGNGLGASTQGVCLKGAEYLPASRSFRLALDEYLPNGP